jgi:dienelactone hydrolase
MRMKTLRIAILQFVFLVAIGFAADTQQKNENQVDPIAIAKEFVNQLASTEYAKSREHFDSTMTALMPEAKVKEIWEQILLQAGSFKSQLGVRTQKFRTYDIVFVTCRFDRDTLDTKVVIDPAGKIAGLFFAPVQAIPTYQPPPYVKREAFREEEVIVGKGQWALHGTLSVPTGTGLFRAVVLVHGSGPNDRDETIGPNKPFRDLAWGLATKGIAVLRYEKRTREHGAELVSLKNTLTVKDETIDDALAAVSLLRSNRSVDSKHIYMLGHSLGATLIPRIGMLEPSITGFVLLAGATRPLEDLMLEQSIYIASLDTTMQAMKQKQIDAIKRQVGMVKSLRISDTTSSQSIFAAPPSYWLDLQGYRPAEMARSLKMPLLVLQGERDYQVTLKDFEGWKMSLGEKKNVEFRLYPKLNHLFIEGSGKSTPSEYDRQGHVAEYVIEDIAKWIAK